MSPHLHACGRRERARAQLSFGRRPRRPTCNSASVAAPPQDSNAGDRRVPRLVRSFSLTRRRKTRFTDDSRENQPPNTLNVSPQRAGLLPIGQ